MRTFFIAAAFIVLPLIGLLLKKPIVRKICGSVLIFEIVFVLLLFTAIAADFPEIKRMLGTPSLWLGIAFCGVILVLCLLAIWKPLREKQRRLISVFLIAAAVVALASVAGVQAYKNSLLEIADGESDMEISLLKYMPFGDIYGGDYGVNATLVKTLDEQATLAFSGNLPILDGATALYPLYSAFARATYPQGDYNPYYALETYEGRGGDLETPVGCNRTSGAFYNLLDGAADIVFLMDVSEDQRELAASCGLELELAPIGLDAFVFIVNSGNKVTGLTQDEVRKIYSGEIANWREVGGANASISAYQRPESSGSQIALEKIMGEAPILMPKSEQVYSTMGGLYNAVSDYKNYKNAIGYSFRYYIETMLNDAELRKVKLLEIDGVAPTAETIADGSYPFNNCFYAVTIANPKGETEWEKARGENARKLIEWINSPQGRKLVEKTGYVNMNY
ncbi:MAG: substrate-binding domain-containing protein [Clostridiales bacterium]|nr:substrate-binding domain-containing protein [Clostridiales bacterium]